jgi:uncharacterized protein
MEIDVSLKEKVRQFSDEHMPADVLHGRSHRDRVLIHAEAVNREVKAQWDIIYIAALCHDIGHSSGSKNHHIASADLTREFLKSMHCENQVIDKITHCILTHSRQYATELPGTEEAKVLYDADGMDLFGAIGLSRALLSCGLAHKGYDCMIKKLKWRLAIVSDFYSETAKEYVSKKQHIIQTYLDALDRELSSFL